MYSNTYYYFPVISRCNCIGVHIITTTENLYCLGLIHPPIDTICIVRAEEMEMTYSSVLYTNLSGRATYLQQKDLLEVTFSPTRDYWDWEAQAAQCTDAC